MSSSKRHYQAVEKVLVKALVEVKILQIVNLAFI